MFQNWNKFFLLKSVGSELKSSETQVRVVLWLVARIRVTQLFFARTDLKFFLSLRKKPVLRYNKKKSLLSCFLVIWGAFLFIIGKNWVRFKDLSINKKFSQIYLVWMSAYISKFLSTIRVLSVFLFLAGG